MKYILIVEDDKLLGREINETFTQAGYGTYWATSGNQALDITEKQQEIHLVLLDIMLPGEIDGYAVLQKLKSNQKTSHIPIVMLSNLGQLDEIKRAMDMGATDYIVKATIDLDDLLATAQKKYLI